MNKKKICLIGNSGIKSNDLGGQTTKVRLYKKLIEQEGYDLFFVDLEGFLKHPISTLLKIRKGIKECDNVVLMTAQRGLKILIPYINFINKKYHKKFILPLIGTSVLHYSIDKLSDEQKYHFLFNNNYSLVKRDRWAEKYLKQIDLILPETDMLTKVFREFYHLDNVETLNNFRDVEIVEKRKELHNPLRLVFLSRVMKQKGIFDLIDAIKDINLNNKQTGLDIYGKKELNNNEETQFNESVDSNIRYLGSIDNSDVISDLSEYDLFVFPTKFVGEGTPGVIAESLIAGTPILSSNFPQSKLLLKEGYDSITYKMFDKNDLKEKLLYLINNRDLMLKMSENAKASAKRFTYKYNRDLFIKYICE